MRVHTRLTSHNGLTFLTAYARRSDCCGTLWSDIPHCLCSSKRLLRFGRHAGLLGIDDVDDPRNVILLFKPLGVAVGNGQLYFSYDQDRDLYTAHLLDNSIRDIKLVDVAKEQKPKVREHPRMCSMTMHACITGHCGAAGMCSTCCSNCVRSVCADGSRTAEVHRDTDNDIWGHGW